MSVPGPTEEYEQGWEDGWEAAYKSRAKKPATKKKALRIVRLLTKAYEAGDNNDTLAFILQREMEKEK